MADKKEVHESQIAQNKRARFDYFIDERYEAGIALLGWEVKSLRAGRAQITEGYVGLRSDEAWLHGCHFSPLNSASTHVVADPVRPRKLLLNRKEIDKLVGGVERKVTPSCRYRFTGNTDVPSLRSDLRGAKSNTTNATPKRTATGNAKSPARYAPAIAEAKLKRRDHHNLYQIRRCGKRCFHCCTSRRMPSTDPLIPLSIH